jgi:enoyl-CoA hydratase/carnithine racemase
MIATEQQGEVTVLRMTDGENRFNPESVGEINAAFDALDAAEGPRAAVLTGEGKFFSNGLDLDWMGGAGREAALENVAGVHALLARTLTAPWPIVAAINGHCFAAGAMLALACDQRVMRADRGFFCLPEVDIGIPFTPGMAALLQATMNPATARVAMTTGHRYGGEDAAAAGIADVAVPEDAVFSTALERAQALAPKAGPTLGAIKQGMYGHVGEALGTPVAFPA